MKPSQKYFLAELAKYRTATVLDFACSTGNLWEHIPPHIDIYGCDIQLSAPMAERIKGREERFRISTDPEKIPYPDGMFDVVFANSAFEHVQPIRQIIGECARVLKPGGRLIAVFPCKTVVIEPHVKVPFASWLPAGRFRQAWCQLWRGDGERAEAYLRRATNYLRYSKYKAMLREHFSVADITGELMRHAGRHPVPGWIVSRFYAAALDATKIHGTASIAK